MKTAISLPDSIFLEAEETAKNMGISRSTLFLNALTEYLKKHNRKNITEKLNEIYNADYYKEDFTAISNTAIENIKEVTKHEAR
jgi:metal-responsive CopG/Arc/MetJ family transcriptional regulator